MSTPIFERRLNPSIEKSPPKPDLLQVPRQNSAAEVEATSAMVLSPSSGVARIAAEIKSSSAEFVRSPSGMNDTAADVRAVSAGVQAVYTEVRTGAAGVQARNTRGQTVNTTIQTHKHRIPSAGAVILTGGKRWKLTNNLVCVPEILTQKSIKSFGRREKKENRE